MLYEAIAGLSRQQDTYAPTKRLLLSFVTRQLPYDVNAVDHDPDKWERVVTSMEADGLTKKIKKGNQDVWSLNFSPAAAGWSPNTTPPAQTAKAGS